MSIKCNKWLVLYFTRDLIEFCIENHVTTEWWPSVILYGRVTVLSVFCLSWGWNGFFVLVSANQLLRNPDKRQLWPPDILAKLENLKKLQINFVTEFYWKHNYYSSELVSSVTNVKFSSRFYDLIMTVTQQKQLCIYDQVHFNFTTKFNYI